jgi:hypothetical protein
MEISPFIHSSVLIGEESPRPRLAENLQSGKQWRCTADDLSAPLTILLRRWRFICVADDLAAPLTI